MTSTDSTLTAIDAKSYKWFFNGDVMPDTTQTIVPKNEGTYQVEVTTDLGCVMMSSPITFYSLNNKGRPFVVGINVEKSQLILSTALKSSWFVRVLDSSGRPIQKAIWNSAENGQIIFNLQGYASGIFFVQVVGEEGAWAQKILKF